LNNANDSEDDCSSEDESEIYHKNGIECHGAGRFEGIQAIKMGMQRRCGRDCVSDRQRRWEMQRKRHDGGSTM